MGVDTGGGELGTERAFNLAGDAVNSPLSAPLSPHNPPDGVWLRCRLSCLRFPSRPSLIIILICHCTNREGLGGTWGVELTHEK